MIIEWTHEAMTVYVFFGLLLISVVKGVVETDDLERIHWRIFHCLLT